MSTDDEAFERAEALCLLATEDPAFLLKFTIAQAEAKKLEHQGWKRRTGMTQHDKVLKHMRRNGSISPHEAIMDHGITRLAARIFELKELGYSIQRTMRVNPTTGASYARYSLLTSGSA